MRQACCAAILMVFGLIGQANALLLAREGQPECVVLRAREASPAERLAADELARYLKALVSKPVSVEVADSTQPTGKGTQLIVCKQGSDLAALAKPAFPTLPPEGFAIGVRGQRIYLVGADDRAVLYAVYALLDKLGCCWLAPPLKFYAGHHEYVPSRPNLEFSPEQDSVSSPALKFRKLYVEEGHSHNAENLKQMIAWMPKLRFNTLVVPIDYSGRGKVKWDNWREALIPDLHERGIIIEVGGHGYQNYLNAEMHNGKLFEEHPEWFGQDESGKRTPNHGRVLCSSNAEAVKFLQASVLDYLKKHPEIEIFDFWPPDGARWCTCDACKAMGTPSDRHAMLVSQMAAAVAKELPKVRVECIAYSSYVEPPTKTLPDKSVLIDFCPIGQCFEEQIYESGSEANKTYAAALNKWLKAFPGDISIYSYYRKYAWCSLPNLIPHYMQNDLQYYRKIGVHGISSYAEPGDWFTYELNHYVLGHLAWDPDDSVDALVMGFCVARYGPAASTAQQTFAMLERVIRHACSLPGTSVKAPGDYDEFTREIEAASSKVKAAREQYARDAALLANLKRLSLMLEYARMDIALQKKRATNADTTARKAEVDALCKFLNEHAADGVFVWHDSRMGTERAYGHYGIPNAGRNKRRAQ